MNRGPWGACPPQRSVPSASILAPTPRPRDAPPLRDQSLSVPSSTATRAPNAGTDHSPGSNTIAPPSFAPRVLPRSARPLTSTAPLDLHEPRPATPLSTNTRFASSLRPKRSHASPPPSAESDKLPQLRHPTTRVCLPYSPYKYRLSPPAALYPPQQRGTASPLRAPGPLSRSLPERQQLHRNVRQQDALTAPILDPQQPETVGSPLSGQIPDLAVAHAEQTSSWIAQGATHRPTLALPRSRAPSPPISESMSSSPPSRP